MKGQLSGVLPRNSSGECLAHRLVLDESFSTAFPNAKFTVVKSVSLKFLFAWWNNRIAGTSARIKITAA